MEEEGKRERGRAGLKEKKGIKQRGGEKRTKREIREKEREKERMEEGNGGKVDQGPAMNGGDHVVFAVQPANHRNHGLGESLLAHPCIKARIFSL